MKLANACRRAGTASTLMLSAAVALLSAAPAQAASGWSATNTHAAELDGASRIGLLDAAAPMRISVALKTRNAAGLEIFLQRIGTPGDREYGRTLSGREFADRHAPTLAQAQAVADYLASAGFRNVEIAPNRLFVTAEGRAADVRRAFRTELATYSHEGRTVFANTRDAQVPRHLAGSVLAVLGLQNLAQVRPMVVRTDAVTTTGHNPLDFQRAYHVGSVGTAFNTSVGIISAGDMTQTLADLSTYRLENSLAAPAVSVVNAGPAGTSTSGTIEWDLDSQTVLGMSGGSVQQIVFYTATSLSLADITLALNRAVTDNVAKAINVSLGSCEKNFKSSGDLLADDNVFRMAIAQGQTFFVSSGDAGAKTGCSSLSRSGLFKAVSYPASSPYVVAVGGTTLSTDSVSGAYASEKAWSKSGGGKSVYEVAASWQVPYTGSVRGVPDVGFTGDPNSGAVIVDNGSHVQVGGTSLSSPLMAAIWARLETAHGNALGFAAPRIYSGYSASHAAFHDVTTGNNGALGSGYTAVAGYDFVTGLGSLDVQSFNGTLP